MATNIQEDYLGGGAAAGADDDDGDEDVEKAALRKMVMLMGMSC